jgi:uncharacterized protein
VATARRPLVVNVGEVLRAAGTRLEVTVTAPVGPIRVVDTELVDPVDVHVVLESVLADASESIVATGHVAARWQAICRRCLDPVSGDVEVPLREVFARHPEGLFDGGAVDASEVIAFRGDTIDLEPTVREVVTLELPLAPLCRDDCGGPDGAAVQDAPADPRWAALDVLRQQFDEPATPGQETFPA